MFRVEVFVDDKRLPELIRRLAGIVLGDPKIQAVANVVEPAKKKPRKAKDGQPRALTDGSIISMLRAKIDADKVSEITTDYVKDFLVSSGRSASSYSYALAQAVEAGILRKEGTGNEVKYLVK